MRTLLIKVVSVVLCVLMLVTVLAACDDKKDGPGGANPGTTTTTTTTTTSGTATTYGDIGIIPEDIDYGGDHETNLLLWNNAKLQLFPEALTDGENISNDLFLRNQMIEDELGILFKTTFKQADGSGSSSSFELLNEAKEGTTPYDAICSFSTFPAELALQGLLVDLFTLDYPNLAMPWYPADITQWSIVGRQFFLTNTSSIRNVLSNWVCYANNVMIESKSLENIEDVVVRGDWTLDTLKTYSRNWATEAESNANKDEADKVYGLAMVGRNVTDAFFHAAGFRMVSLDSEGKPNWTFLYDTTSMNNISAFLDDIVDICDSPEIGYGWAAGSSGVWLEPLYNKNAAFFMAALDCYYATTEDGTFSILPLPKLDSEQERYYTTRNFAYDVWCVPSDADDIELGGLIIEATSFNDYDEIAPTFFDKDFKYRYSSSDRGARIFDMIRQAYSVEFALGWGTVISAPYEQMRWCLTGKTMDQVNLSNVFAIEVGGMRNSLNQTMRSFQKQIGKLYPVE